MKVKATIPITTTACAQYHTVKYKKVADSVWTTLSPDPLASPIVIDYLDEGDAYNLSIVTRCCDGQLSSEVTTTFTPTV